MSFAVVRWQAFFDRGASAARGLVCAAVLAPILAACAADLGDFGRPRPNVWNDSLLPGAGEWLALARSEAVSGFPLTDDELILRDRAFRFLMPPHHAPPEMASWRGLFDTQVQELARTRLLPVRLQATEPGTYLASLLSRPFRSQTSRYHRLVEDAQGDRALIGPFRQVAQAVAAADRARLLGARSVAPDIALAAQARVQENEGLVAWVVERLDFRIAEYRHALTGLVVRLPAREAILVEHALLALEAERKRLSGLVGEAFGLPPPPPPPVVVKH